jgi:hypothetical protein
MAIAMKTIRKKYLRFVFLKDLYNTEKVNSAGGKISEQ